MKKLTLFSALLLTTTIFAQVPAYVPTNGLVGWWPFNGNANDESGNGNNGTVNGPALTTDRNGVINSAYSFDGVDDKIEVQNSPNLNFGINPTFTISFWLNKSNLISSGVMCKAEPYNGFGWSGWNYFNDDFSTGYPCLNNPILVSSNVWEFVVVIVDNGNITKFVNDQIYGQHSCSQITTNSISTIHNMYFGVDRDIANYFSGKIDEIGIWNRALTDCEIKNLYNAEVTNSSQTQTALDSYTWPVNNQTYTQSGIYTDTLVNAAGCDSVITLNLSLEYTGIDEHNAVNVLVSPNPITNTFSISGIEQIGSLSLKDLSGILIKSFDVQEKNYSISNVTSGVYFLEVSDEKRTYMIKVVKE